MTMSHSLNQGDGVTAGVHNGAHFYTVGQRKGLTSRVQGTAFCYWNRHCRQYHLCG
ncbi:MAG: tRNA methyl transferase PRC-barrel domain-containing protein [Bacteroidales bacterium]